MSPNLERLITARLAERHVDKWKEFFVRVSASRFLTGGGKQGFVATLEWLMKEQTVEKVLAGQYDDRPQGQTRRAEEMGKAGQETWDQIVEVMMPTFEDFRERLYFERVAIVSDTANELVVASFFAKRLTDTYRERIERAAGQVRAGLHVTIQDANTDSLSDVRTAA
jgi:hypothetical protein